MSDNDQDENRVYKNFMKHLAAMTPAERAQMEEGNFGQPRPPVSCSRCDSLTENPPVGCGYVNGHGIDDLVLCVSCRGLQHTDRRAFWDEGWKRYPRR